MHKYDFSKIGNKWGNSQIISEFYSFPWSKHPQNIHTKISVHLDRHVKCSCVYGGFTHRMSGLLTNIRV